MFKKKTLNLQAEPIDKKLLIFIIRAQHVAQQDPYQEGGYAMVIVSIVTILLFSLMSAYLTLTNLTSSSTNAYIDSNNTFYAAESGLNQRANQLRQRFVGYAVPTGLSPGQTTAADAVLPTNIANCFSLSISTSTSDTDNDFECRNYGFKYNNNSATVEGRDGSTQAKDLNKQIDYTTFTFVADRTVYDPTSTVAAPVVVTIPAGQTYSGLNAQKYLYTVYSTAAKVDPTNPVASLQRGDAKTVLQMDFKSQIIPLFQFAAFYDRDLEINSTTAMTLTGRVHTNANLYVQPTPIASTDPGIDFLSKVTVAGDIYNRVDAANTPVDQQGTTRVVTSPYGVTPITYASFPPYSESNKTPITDLSTFANQVANQGSGVNPLNPPQPGFLRKRNYYTNKIGEYFGKADLRLQMTPNSPVPFKFTAIQSGPNARGGACTTSYTPGQDPPQNYIDPEREGSNFKCTELSLGQITSLQQPVLALTHGNTEEETKFCAQPADGSIDRTKKILNYAAGVTVDSTTAGLSAAQIDKVLRALQVTISGARQPLDYQNVSAGGLLPPDLQTTFATLLADPILNIGLTSPAQITAISKAAPASIAKARKSCFLPAPIVMVDSSNGYNGNNPPPQPELQVPDTGGGGTPPPPPPPEKAISRAIEQLWIQPANAQATPRLSGNSNGLYDPREWRTLQVVQTNIESLTVWNRDGRFVNLSTNLTEAATADDLRAALNPATADVAPTNPPAADAFAGNSLLFVRAQPRGSTIGSFEYLGLGSADMTERGLVLHAHVDDYLDGRTSGGTSDILPNLDRPIYKTKADNNWVIDSATGQPIILDYHRKYPNAPAIEWNVSPYAFAINGGRNLPGAMTIATDQAVYLQGNYNTFAKKPAAIMADTITMLSVNCVSPGKIDAPGIPRDPLGAPAANINCLLAPWSDFGSSKSPWTGSDITSSSQPMYGAQPTSVNAAFLSFTLQSWGNLGSNRGYGYGYWYSGGLNNYMRFVENWNGQSFDYNGSLVSLGVPLEFSGGFRPGGRSNSYFYPPGRNFTYDTDFNSFPKLPPMTPSVIFLQQDVFKRN